MVTGTTPSCRRVRKVSHVIFARRLSGLPGISGSTVAAPAAGAAGSIDKALKAFGKRDYGAAGRLFFPLAEVGNAVAQLHLGKMSESGLGVPANQAEAAKWYAMAAALGEPTAQYNLALMDEVGTHALGNPDQRGALIRSAANAGHADAQFKLACGLVDSEPVRAAAWFSIAARNGTSWRRDRCATLDLSPDDGRAAAELAQRCYESKYVDCAVAAEKAPIQAVTPTAAGVTKTAGAMRETDDSRTSLGSAALLALVQVTVRFGLAFATYTALTFGVGKPRSRPTQHGRWVGAWGAALAVASARTNVDLPETIIGTLVMAVTLFACGFISGYIWRRFRPFRSLDAAGRAT